jgi:rhomboid-like protein
MNIFFPLGPTALRVGIRTLSCDAGRIACATTVRYLTTTSRSGTCWATSLSQNQPCISSLPRARRHSFTQSERYLPRISVRTAARFTATTQYHSLPDDYEDALGIEFRKEPLTQREVSAIFKTSISADEANELLKIIQGRRVAGTLDDPDLQQNTSHYGVEDKIAALEYLRKHIPVDEVINAGLRAEDELRFLEEQSTMETAAEESLQNTEAPRLEPRSASQSDRRDVEREEAPLSGVPTGRLPRKPKPDSPYGESQFDRIRKERVAKREAEERRLEEEQRRKEEEEALGNIGPLSTQTAAPRQMSPWTQQHYDAATDLQAPPEMKWWERLMPTYAVAVLLLAGCAVFAVYYEPLPRDQRVWPDIPPAAATCITLAMLNTAMLIAWRYPPLWKFLNKYALVVAATPRPAQLVGAMFSHHEFRHFATNMIVLWIFGKRLHDDIGRGNFLAIYFASGILGFVASLTQLVLWRGLQFTTLGASGAIYGVIAAYFWLHRFEEFKILGLPPDPVQGPQGLAFLGLIVGLHIFGLFSKSAAAALVDIPSHLGGMLAAVLGISLVQKRMESLNGVRTETIKSTINVPDIDVTKKASKPEGSRVVP